MAHDLSCQGYLPPGDYDAFVEDLIAARERRLAWARREYINAEIVLVACTSGSNSFSGRCCCPREARVQLQAQEIYSLRETQRTEHVNK